MGKGDKKTKRGKIFAGSFGKSRPKPKKLQKLKKDEGRQSEPKKSKKEEK